MKQVELFTTEELMPLFNGELATEPIAEVPAPTVVIHQAPRMRLTMEVDHADEIQYATLRSPTDVAGILMSRMMNLPQEHLVIVMMDTKNRIIGINTVYIGTLNCAHIRISEVLRPSILTNSCGFVMVHNHPSGEPSPSPEDVALTRLVADAGRLMDIELMDHIIIGRNMFVSLKERGLGF